MHVRVCMDVVFCMYSESEQSYLKQVRQSIKEKHHGKICHEILLHQDNAPVHKSQMVMGAVHEYELFPHPTYSPHLAATDFQHFLKLKKHVRGRRFEDDNKLTVAVEDCYENQSVKFYWSGISDWQSK